MAEPHTGPLPSLAGMRLMRLGAPRSGSSRWRPWRGGAQQTPSARLYGLHKAGSPSLVGGRRGWVPSPYWVPQPPRRDRGLIARPKPEDFQLTSKALLLQCPLGVFLELSHRALLQILSGRIRDSVRNRRADHFQLGYIIARFAGFAVGTERQFPLL